VARILTIFFNKLSEPRDKGTLHTQQSFRMKTRSILEKHLWTWLGEGPGLMPPSSSPRQRPPPTASTRAYQVSSPFLGPTPSGIEVRCSHMANKYVPLSPLGAQDWAHRRVCLDWTQPCRDDWHPVTTQSKGNREWWWLCQNCCSYIDIVTI
jgi:hypothetical protein